MADTKNPGPLLQSRVIGSVDVIPQEWVAKIGFRQDDQEEPLGVLPDSIAGLTVASKLVQTRTDERKQTDVVLNPPPIGGWSMNTQEMLPNGQIATRTRNFVADGTALPTGDTTLEATQKNLGVGYLDQLVLNAPLPGPTIVQTQFDNLATLVNTSKTRKLISTITDGEIILGATRRITTHVGESLTVATEAVAADVLPGTSVISSRIEADGGLVTVTRTKKKSSTIIEGETVAVNVWKKTYREGETGLVAVEVVETRLLPTPAVTTSRIESDGLIVNVSKIRKLASTIVTVETVVGITWKKVFKEGDDSLVATEVTEIATLPGPTNTSSRVEADGMVVTILKTRKSSATIVPAETIVGTTWKKVYGEGLDLLVATEIVETRTLPGPAVISNKIDPDGGVATTTRTRKKATDIIAVENITGGFWFHRYKEGVDGLVATEVVEARPMPGTVVPSASVDQDEEIVNVTKTLKSQNLVTPSATLSGTTITTVEQREVSDLVSQEVRSTRTFLNKNILGKSKSNPLPPRFQSAVAVNETSNIVGGTANVPTLGAQELERSEQQVDRLLKRVSVKDFSPTLPVTLTDKEFTTEYGGLLLSVENKLDLTNGGDIDITQADLANKFLVRAKRTRFGPYYLRERAISLSTFPILIGAEYDESLNLVFPYTQQVVDAGTVGSKILGAVTTIRPLDLARSLQKKTFAAADMATFVMAFVGTTNIDFPPQLMYFKSVVAAAAGSAGSYGQNGQYTIYNGGSEGIHLEGNAEGSAAASLDIQTNIKQIWGQNVPCTHYLFFVPGPVAAMATIINKLSTYGVAAATWPKFKPEAVQITCVGQKLGGRCRADLQHRDSFIADYLGAVQRSGGARTAGTGFSFDTEIVVKTVTIPPTIHTALTLIGGGTSTQGFTAAAQVGTNIQSTTVGVSGNATAHINPTTIPATGGQSSIPTAGWFIHGLRIEPYKFGYLKVDAELVNATSWT